MPGFENSPNSPGSSGLLLCRWAAMWLYIVASALAWRRMYVRAAPAATGRSQQRLQDRAFVRLAADVKRVNSDPSVCCRAIQPGLPRGVVAISVPLPTDRHQAVVGVVVIVGLGEPQHGEQHAACGSPRQWNDGQSAGALRNCPRSASSNTLAVTARGLARAFAPPMRLRLPCGARSCDEGPT